MTTESAHRRNAIREALQERGMTVGALARSLDVEVMRVYRALSGYDDEKDLLVHIYHELTGGADSR